jgi:hypothetical protein
VGRTRDRERDREQRRQREKFIDKRERSLLTRERSLLTRECLPGLRSLSHWQRQRAKARGGREGGRRSRRRRRKEGRGGPCLTVCLFITDVIHAHAYVHTIEAKDPSLGASDMC